MASRILRHRWVVVPDARGRATDVSRCALCASERRTSRGSRGSVYGRRIEQSFRPPNGDWGLVPPGCRIPEQPHFFEDYPCDFSSEEEDLFPASDLPDAAPDPASIGSSGRGVPDRDAIEARNRYEARRQAEAHRRALAPDPYAAFGLRRRERYQDPPAGSRYEDLVGPDDTGPGYEVVLTFDAQDNFEFGVLATGVKLPDKSHWREHVNEQTALERAQATLTRVAQRAFCVGIRSGARALLVNRDTGDQWRWSLAQGKFTCTAHPT